MPIEVGKAAPLFTLVDPAGKKVALRDLRGKNVVIYFYPRDETPGCTKEACAFRDLSRQYRKLDTEVLGISPDDSESHRNFAKNHRLRFILLSDPDKKVMTRYGAWGEKVLYGKRTIGVIRSTVWIDPKGKVRRHWRRVPKAADHPQKVLEAIQADQNGG